MFSSSSRFFKKLSILSYNSMEWFLLLKILHLFISSILSKYHEVQRNLKKRLSQGNPPTLNSKTPAKDSTN